MGERTAAPWHLLAAAAHIGLGALDLVEQVARVGVHRVDVGHRELLCAYPDDGVVPAIVQVRHLSSAVAVAVAAGLGERWLDGAEGDGGLDIGVIRRRVGSSSVGLSVSLGRSVSVGVSGSTVSVSAGWGLSPAHAASRV